MFRSVLVVCVGNICRSPIGERLLLARLQALGTSITVSSAGIAALVGHAADDTAAKVAKAHGLCLEGHVARQFSRDLGLKDDLIVTMEAGHRRQIINVAPDLSGRVMLFDHWLSGNGIPDPYAKPPHIHEEVFVAIEAAAEAWAGKLVASGNVVQRG